MTGGYAMILKWLREPLLHFLVLGAALFGLYQLATPPAGPGDDEIVVTTGQIDHIVEVFSKVRFRAPTTYELQNLIDEHILEEVVYREAMNMGLDEDDTIIRRRLRQKLEFLVDDFATAQPDDDQLLEFLKDNPDLFREDALLSFEHVVFTGDGEARAATLLAELRSGAEVDLLVETDSSLLPGEFLDASEREVSALFGDAFVEGLLEAEVGGWSGPVGSSVGTHVVNVRDRTESRVPALAEIRDSVAREWVAYRRRTAQETFFDQLRSQYEITVELDEWLNDPADDVAVAENAP